MANSKIGMGSTFVGTSASGLTTASSIVGISLPNIAVDVIDDTDMDATNNFKEFYGGLKDSGEVTLTLSHVDSQFKALTNAAAITDTFTLTLPKGGLTTANSMTFSGFVTGVGGDIPHDEKITNTATIKISGAITMTTFTT